MRRFIHALSLVLLASRSAQADQVQACGAPAPPPKPPADNECIYDVASGGAVQLIDPTSLLPVINNGSLAKIVQEASDHWVNVLYKPVKPSSLPENVYDVQLVSDSPLYLAIYKSGKVGFVATSSNGQTYVGSGDDSYVTSVFSFPCDGYLTAAIAGGSEFVFSITADQQIVTSAGAAPKSKRDIVPRGWYTLPEIGPKTPSGQRCLAGQTAKFNGVPPTSNGCGPEGGVVLGLDLIPDLWFGQCCNGHDLCYGTCDESFDSCNTDFHTCMKESCVGQKLTGLKRLTCETGADMYYHYVDTKGRKPFDAANKYSCVCECDDKSKYVCNNKCVDLDNDPNNCGDCDFYCESGACEHGACTFDSCSGSVCSAFNDCGSGGDCVCASTSGGNGFCVNGDQECDSLMPCLSNEGCPTGAVCAVSTCCGFGVCVATDFCGGYQQQHTRDLHALMKPRASGWKNATIGNPQGWYDKV
ncbi:hypothetical protein NLG97_g7082 [Lecanicillium saksenae]|uniref:Uncharacterized protein n=1 Tax=Lecanicillium saksenae TaxID=468837 RepID=A0ACC1QQU5_9HYPO|nr:hypothetical protein NLG97_g7082 [Lecanicillium saksenae]